MTSIVDRLRENADSFNGGGPHDNPNAWPDLYRDAADLLEFFFGQLQMHSPRMDGQHSYRFRGGWPMTHCVGPDPEVAVASALREMNTGSIKAEWAGWIAVKFDSGDDVYWCISPKDFWEKNQCIPDYPLEKVPEGFFETQEHTLDSSRSLSRQGRMLEDLGFEIVEWR